MKNIAFCTNGIELAILLAAFAFPKVVIHGADTDMCSTETVDDDRILTKFSSLVIDCPPLNDYVSASYAFKTPVFDPTILSSIITTELSVAVSYYSRNNNGDTMSTEEGLVLETRAGFPRCYFVDNVPIISGGSTANVSNSECNGDLNAPTKLCSKFDIPRSESGYLETQSVIVWNQGGCNDTLLIELNLLDVITSDDIAEPSKCTSALEKDSVACQEDHSTSSSMHSFFNVFFLFFGLIVTLNLIQ